MPTRDDIFAILATIPDPEMPISIVDLGLVEDVRIDSPRPVGEESGVRASGGSVVTITLLPTFIGCPALDMIRDEVRAKVGALPGVDGVVVRFIHDPPWSADRITDSGRTSLRAHGVQVPDRGPLLRHGAVASAVQLTSTIAVPCPFCGSTSTRMESPFGPTRCRSIFYCDACRNSFENIRRVK